MGVLKNQIPWDLRQRGARDSQRHSQKIKQAIKKNLHHIIAEEAIITTDGQRKTRVPIKYLDSYYFKHGVPQDGVGHGDGEKGQVLQEGQAKGKPGDKAGKGKGQDIYEAEISLEELTDMMIEDLGLPFFENKDKKEIITKHTEWTDIRKKGMMANWAKKQTVLENIKRNAREHNEAKLDKISEDDMRFRSWDEKIEKHSNCVVYLMMDRSGSMDDHKRYLTKATFWWICRFLERRYDNFEVIFIAHDDEAKIVPEKDFFTISNDGGTRCSSAYELALEDIKASRPKSIWNVYCFHFSDGDNLHGDNEKCVDLVKELLGRVNMFAYGEVSFENSNWHSESGLVKSIETIKDPHVMTAVLKDKNDVFPTLQRFLNKELGNKEKK